MLASHEPNRAGSLGTLSPQSELLSLKSKSKGGASNVSAPADEEPSRPLSRNAAGGANRADGSDAGASLRDLEAARAEAKAAKSSAADLEVRQRRKPCAHVHAAGSAGGRRGRLG